MTLLRRLSDELAAVVALASPAVVGLVHRRGQGSGVVLADDGYRTASWVAAVLIQRGEVQRPRIGVLARSEEAPSAARAVRILRVEKGAPADKAGLENGDLLLRANGDETATLDDLQRALALSDAAEILLEVRRGEQLHSLRIKPEAARAA